MTVTEHYRDEQVTLLLGDALEALPTLPDASIDAIVTDPPYGLAELATATVLQAIAAWMAGDRTHVPDGRGFMGNDWDRFVPPPGIWDQCLRVLKPGGHLLAFAGSRTADLMGLSIRIAGFDIRDTITWHYGSGMPKSLNLKDASGERTGWGTGLKPASEPIIVARKPLAGTVAATVLAHGTGALSIDVCRTPAGQDYADKCASVVGIDSPRHGDTGGERYGARKDSTHAAGRWPTNVVLSHQPLLSPSGEPIGDACADGCAPGCPVAEMDRQSGHSVSSKDPKRFEGTAKFKGGTYAGDAYSLGMTRGEAAVYGDSGGASRFFPVFRYEAKAPASERPRLADGTAWPTVKPLQLIRWLVRLVTQPGGTVLDPFNGTGTTLEACIAEGMRGIGIEREQTAADLTVIRLSKPIALGLFGDTA